MKKKLILSLVSIFLAILFVSPSTVMAENLINVEKSSVALENEKSQTYVDPNILITREKLPLLKKSVERIEDEDTKFLVKEIINLLEENVEVNGNDIKNIIYNTDTEIIGIHSGIIRAKLSPGSVIPFPGWLIALSFLPYIGPCLIVKWKGFESYYADLDIGINLIHEYKHNHTGVAVLFFGYLGNTMIGTSIKLAFRIFGYSPLIVIKDS